MRQDKLLSITFAAIAIAGGLYCIIKQGLALETMAMIAGLGMVFNGLASLFTWLARRAAGVGDTWLLVTSIISFVAGILLWSTGMAKIVVFAMIVVLLAVWLIGVGVFDILHGMSLRKLHVDLETEWLGKNWWLLLLGGIILILAGVFCLIYPLFALNLLSLLIGGSLLVGGLGIIACSFAE